MKPNTKMFTLHLALVAPEARHAHCRAEFPGFCLLLTRNRGRLPDMQTNVALAALRAHHRRRGSRKYFST